MSRPVVPVTVVSPVLNEADTLPALLDGLAAQTSAPAEIIFCDAGSTDGTPEIIARWWAGHAWTGTTLRVLSRPGALPGAGRNTGIRAATQEWIAFVDGGTCPEPDWLENLVTFVRGSGRAAFGMCRFSGHGTVQRALCALSYGYLTEHATIPSSLIHREVFDRVGFFREDLRAAEDLLWVQRYEDLCGPRPLCAGGVIHYVHLESSLGAIFQKWRRGELNAVRAGVRRFQQRVYLVGMPLLLASLVLGPTVPTAAAYTLARAVYDPIRRSKRKYWWRNCWAAPIAALAIAPTIDVAKWIGIVHGLAEKLTSRAGGSPRGHQSLKRPGDGR